MLVLVEGSVLRAEDQVVHCAETKVKGTIELTLLLTLVVVTFATISKTLLGVLEQQLELVVALCRAFCGSGLLIATARDLCCDVSVTGEFTFSVAV